MFLAVLPLAFVHVPTICIEHLPFSVRFVLELRFGNRLHFAHLPILVEMVELNLNEQLWQLWQLWNFERPADSLSHNSHNT